MVLKGIKAGDKRKASTNERISSKAPPKKAKIDSKRKPLEDELSDDNGESSGFSDSEDGGAALESQKNGAQKENKFNKAKTGGNDNNGNLDRSKCTHDLH